MILKPIVTSITIYTSIYLGAAEQGFGWFTPAMYLACAMLGLIVGRYYGEEELNKRRREILE